MNEPTIPYLVAVWNESKRRRDHIVDVELVEARRFAAGEFSAGTHALQRDANMLWQILRGARLPVVGRRRLPIVLGMPHQDRLVGS